MPTNIISSYLLFANRHGASAPRGDRFQRRLAPGFKEGASGSGGEEHVASCWLLLREGQRSNALSIIGSSGDVSGE